MIRDARCAVPGAARSTAGFTLVEMLIALVVAGVLASGVVTLLMRQNSFYGKNDDTIFAEQTVRGTAELVASELRMAAPEDLLTANADSVQLRFDVLRAVVCGNNGSSTVYIYVYDQPTGANLPSGRGTAVSAPLSSSFSYDDGFNGSGSASTTALTTCTAANDGVAQSTDPSLFRSVSWSGSSLSLPDEGSVLRVYGTLTYSFAASSFTSGTALWRGSQELVAPFSSGAAFSYVEADGSVHSSVTGAGLADIRTVRVSGTAQGSGSNRFDVNRDLSFDVPLRNVQN